MARRNDEVPVIEDPEPLEPEDAAEVMSAAAALAYEADQQVAVLVSQRMLGRKQWLGSK